MKRHGADSDRLGGRAMMSSVIGGAMLPHAPQFFTMPETEDHNTVERVKTTAAEIGTRLRAQCPELWIIFAVEDVRVRILGDVAIIHARTSYSPQTASSGMAIPMCRRAGTESGPRYRRT
jgi:hypothetical protein